MEGERAHIPPVAIGHVLRDLILSLCVLAVINFQPCANPTKWSCWETTQLVHAVLNEYADMHRIMHKVMGVHRILFKTLPGLALSACMPFLALSPNLCFSSFASLSFQKYGLKNCGSMTE